MTVLTVLLLLGTIREGIGRIRQEEVRGETWREERGEGEGG